MTMQFIVEANQRNLQTEQMLPCVFTETLYTGNPWLYLIHNRGKKHKVWLRKVSGTNNYALFSNEWKEFLHDSKYVRVSTFYFIRQGMDEYYVTTYHNGGFECNGYDLVIVGQRQKRCLVTMGDMEESPFLVNLEHNRLGVMVSGIRVSTVTQHRVDLPGDRRGHVLYGQEWSILAQVQNLKVGTKLVFKNLLNNTVSLVPLDDSGIALVVENVPRMALNEKRPFVKSPTDKDKRMKHECDWVDHEEKHEMRRRASILPFWHM
nr:DNA-binding pseudobarrel domain-containing protein [Tanacetum cinerariifolium]